MTLLESAPTGTSVEPGTTYSIAEVAERVGVTAHTLRYYERVGLLEVARDGGGRRAYRDSDLGRIIFITRLRSTRLPISELQRYFELVDAGPDTEPERLALLERHRDEVRRQLGEVEAALAAIEFKIDLYGGRLEACAVAPAGPDG